MRCRRCIDCPALFPNGCDRRPAGGNVLTRKVLAELPPFGGPKVIYGESCRLSGETLAAARVTFKQIPYDIKAR